MIAVNTQSNGGKAEQTLLRTLIARDSLMIAVNTQSNGGKAEKTLLRTLIARDSLMIAVNTVKWWKGRINTAQNTNSKRLPNGQNGCYMVHVVKNRKHRVQTRPAAEETGS